MQENNAKMRLLKAGLELFSKKGFDGVSTRELAGLANINISAIAYYFGGKEKLYSAVIDMMSEKFEKEFEPVFSRIEELEDKPKTEVQKTLNLLIEKYIDLLLSPEVPDSVSILIVREQINDTPIFNQIYERIISKVHKAFTKLVGYMVDEKEDTPDLILKTHSIMGQMLIFRLGKNIVKKRLGVEHLDLEHIDKIKKLVVSQTEAVLGGQA